MFRLYGYKLRARWTLVKTKRGEKDWLLIKERDAAVREGGDTVLPEDSVLPGRTGAARPRASLVPLTHQGIQKPSPPQKAPTSPSGPISLLSHTTSFRQYQPYFTRNVYRSFFLSVGRTGQPGDEQERLPTLRDRSGTVDFPGLARWLIM
jgi:hypothetical protein